jgi:methylglutaconyl-CoA hydratase
MTLLSARYFTDEEGQEGIRAFAEKRQPRWAAPAAPTTAKVLP